MYCLTRSLLLKLPSEAPLTKIIQPGHQNLWFPAVLIFLPSLNKRDVRGKKYTGCQGQKEGKAAPAIPGF